MTQAMYMFDDVNPALDPSGAWAYAGYVDGMYANFVTLQKTFPDAHLLSITVFGNKADCADVETGDMTNASVYAWFTKMQADGVWRPCVYTSAANMKAMQETMAANGFARSSYRLWSAHYTGNAHFCAPTTCGFGLDQADATQFTDRALGKSLDESIVSDTFFQTAPLLNPVKNLKANPRWTSITLSWAASAATSCTVRVYEDPEGINREVQNLTAVTPGIRVGNLVRGEKYRLTVRAHPGGSVGADASVIVTTR